MISTQNCTLMASPNKHSQQPPQHSILRTPNGNLTNSSNSTRTHNSTLTAVQPAPPTAP